MQAVGISLLPDDEGADPLVESDTLESLLRLARANFDVSSSDDETTDSDEAQEWNASGRSNAAQRFNNVCLRPLSHNIGLLMELSPTLEASYKFRHQTRVKRSRPPISVTNAATIYVGNVRDKFPRAAQELVDRLGEANWQRHERLRNVQVPELQEALAPVAVDIPKSLFQPVSLFKDSALGSSLPTVSERQDSVASHSSFLSSNAGEPVRLRVPRIPIAPDWGKPYPCPFCKMTINIHNRVDWK